MPGPKTPHAPAPLARALTPDDLEGVIAIDARLSGRARRTFFQHRLKAALAAPAGFITAAADGPHGLAGFAIARIQQGEFGQAREVAVLDVIGVAPDAAHHGVGHALIARLDERMRARGIADMRTQAGWRHHDLLRFLENVGFGLAPYTVLELDLATPRDF